MNARNPLSIEQVMQLAVFTTEEAAIYTRLSRQTLEGLRVKGGGPRYAKLSRRVLYRRAALDEWLAANEQNHTAEGA